MENQKSNYTCIKCGTEYEVQGMEATNKAMPGANITMLSCTCPKCGFMEIRMDDKGFAQVFEQDKN